MPGDGPGRDDGGGEEAGWAWRVLRSSVMGRLLLQYNIAGRPWQHCVERAWSGEPRPAAVSRMPLSASA
jgi:hypothetical protein